MKTALTTPQELRITASAKAMDGVVPASRLTHWLHTGARGYEVVMHRL